MVSRTRARKRAATALVAELSDEHLARMDRLLVIDLLVVLTPFAWLKAKPVAPKADHVRELLDRLHLVRARTRRHLAAGIHFKTAGVMFLDLVPTADVQRGLFDAPDTPRPGSG